MLSNELLEGYLKFLKFNNKYFELFVHNIYIESKRRETILLTLHENANFNNELNFDKQRINNLYIDVSMLNISNQQASDQHIIKCFFKIINKMKHQNYIKQILKYLYKQINERKKQVIKYQTGDVIIENGNMQDNSMEGRINKIKNFVYNRIGI